MSKIFVIGSSNTDMVIQSQHHPKPGETVMGSHFLINPGGKGANQAVAAARVGGQVVLVAKVGNDLFGSEAIQHFESEGIHTKYVSKQEGQPSGVALITVDAKGENTIVVAAGANQFLSLNEIDEVCNSFRAGDYALFQLEIPLETVQYGIERAAEHHVNIILNPAPAQALPENMLKHIFLITPNETEATLLTGIEVVDLSTAQQAGEQLLSKGIQHVIITLGEKGAFYASKTETLHVESPKVAAIDTTAAGDCFNGALAYALSQQMPWKEAITFACKAASFSVTKRGAQASMPYLTDLQ